MSKKKREMPKPTGAELELLGVLWERGPSTVREVHESSGGTKGTGYTTTLKILQKMADKGLVERDESKRSHVYRAAGRPEVTQRRLGGELMERAFGGSPAKLMVQALSDDRATPEELAEMRRLLDELESNQKKGK